MRRKKRCRVCRRGFWPHPRSGDRQRVCGEGACQRERHRRSCAEWRAENPDYDRERRLRPKVQLERPAGAARPSPDPLAEIGWSAARDAAGAEVAVIMRLLSEVLVQWTRDVAGAEAFGIVGDFSKEGSGAARDAIGRGPPAA
jgi:hypothetical protein